jgi:peptidoglycan hydrolase CwlO-like protein
VIGAALGFLGSPIGKVLLILAALTWWTVHNRNQAAEAARTECRAEQLQKTLDEMERQKGAAEKALAEAEKQQAETDKELAELEAERDRIIAENAAPTDAEKRECRRLSPAMRERLQRIK